MTRQQADQLLEVIDYGLSSLGKVKVF